MKKYVSFLLAVCIILLPVFASGCLPRNYSGDNIDLYTVAVNSIFGANGCASNGEAVCDPFIEIIDSDEYGRVLFFYYEGNRGNNSYSILIMQKATDDAVYFYEDLCYSTYTIVDETPFWYGEYYKVYTDADYSTLKERNDWGKEIDESKCISKPFTVHNKGKFDASEEIFEPIIADYVRSTSYKGDDLYYIYRYDVFNTSDDCGRELYYVYGVGYDALGEGISPNSMTVYFDFAIIVNSDGSYNADTCIIEIGDIANCREQIIEFKKANGWRS